MPVLVHELTHAFDFARAKALFQGGAPYGLSNLGGWSVLEKGPEKKGFPLKP